MYLPRKQEMLIAKEKLKAKRQANRIRQAERKAKRQAKRKSYRKDSTTQAVKEQRRRRLLNRKRSHRRWAKREAKRQAANEPPKVEVQPAAAAVPSPKRTAAARSKRPAPQTSRAGSKRIKAEPADTEVAIVTRRSQRNRASVNYALLSGFNSCEEEEEEDVTKLTVQISGDRLHHSRKAV